MPELSERKDPYGAFNFLVEIDGIIKAGFTSVSGLDLTVEFDPVREGGVNDFEYKLPKGLKYSDITLKNGFTDWELWDWCQDFALGESKRKSGSIHLCDDSGTPVKSWLFIEAYPTKWIGPSLDSTRSAVATESLVLAHHGLYKA